MEMTTGFIDSRWKNVRGRASNPYGKHGFCVDFKRTDLRAPWVPAHKPNMLGYLRLVHFMKLILKNHDFCISWTDWLHFCGLSKALSKSTNSYKNRGILELPILGAPRNAHRGPTPGAPSAGGVAAPHGSIKHCAGTRGLQITLRNTLRRLRNNVGFRAEIRGIPRGKRGNPRKPGVLF